LGVEVTDRDLSKTRFDQLWRVIQEKKLGHRFGWMPNGNYRVEMWDANHRVKFEGPATDTVEQALNGAKALDGRRG
jgi:hypothetical protein